MAPDVNVSPLRVPDAVPGPPVAGTIGKKCLAGIGAERRHLRITVVPRSVAVPLAIPSLTAAVRGTGGTAGILPLRRMAFLGDPQPAAGKCECPLDPGGGQGIKPLLALAVNNDEPGVPGLMTGNGNARQYCGAVLPFPRPGHQDAPGTPRARRGRDDGGQRRDHRVKYSPRRGPLRSRPFPASRTRNVLRARARSRAGLRQPRASTCARRTGTTMRVPGGSGS